MDNNITTDILDKHTKTCICKAISKFTIKNAIKNGATTISQVQAKTGAGNGSCKGCRCIPKIEQLINEYNK